MRLDLGALWRNSPVAVVAVFFVGISNGAFGTLSAVYASNVGLALTSVALFSSLPILAGAIAQIPVGWLSDRVDRRKVLLGIAGLAIAADAAFVLLAPQGRALNLALAGVFGAAIFAMYPVIVAHANDHAPEGSGIQISGGLLLLYGTGSIAGPGIAGGLMSMTGATGLFITSAGAHVAIILFTLLRIRHRAPVPTADKGSFVAGQAARIATPETAALAAGGQANDPAPPTRSRG